MDSIGLHGYPIELDTITPMVRILATGGIAVLRSRVLTTSVYALHPWTARGMYTLVVWRAMLDNALVMWMELLGMCILPIHPYDVMDTSWIHG